MRRSVFIVVLLCYAMSGFAQTAIDSLKRLITAERSEDTTRVKRLSSLVDAYVYNKPDSAFSYANRALQLSRKLRYEDGEASAISTLGLANWVLGDYAQAMQWYFQALNLYRNMKRPISVAGVEGLIADIYKEIGDYKQALQYFFDERKIVEDSPDNLRLEIPDVTMEARLMLSDLNIADAYLAGGILDSALFFARRGFLTDRKFSKVKGGWPGSWSLAALVLGNVYLKRAQLDSALYCFHLTFDMSGQNDLIDINNGIGAVYRKQNQTDSCYRYAKMAFDTAQVIHYRKGIMRASESLAWVYEETAPVEAIRYFKISTSIKDSLYNQEKISRINILQFDEKLKEQEQQATQIKYQNRLKIYGLLVVVGFFLAIALILWQSNRHRQKAYALLQTQKKETDEQREKAEVALTELKSTQTQLIHSEKMASLGQLTSGIAHEIQNPLNFVNNFSEINKELLEELKEEAEKGNIEDIKAIANDVIENEEKINHHGKRADAIVKNMLQHSRTNKGQKEPTDINNLCDEYLRLAFHGFRAKDKDFNAEIKTDFDETIGKINVVPQDIGRVLLNLFNNAFYALNEKLTAQGSQLEAFKPTVSVQTKKLDDKVEITVSDNGNGIPQNIVDKIFQPFFTTKPTGEGTGLGLSLSYDIIKAHGGEIKVETKEYEGTVFIIQLPK